MAYQAVTLTTLRTRLKEKWESVPFWTDLEARDALNEGLRVWNLLTGLWKTQVSVPLTQNLPWIELPSTITYSMRVGFGAGFDPTLDPASLIGLDNGRANWEAERTNSGGDVPTAPALWFPVGLTRMGIWPATHLTGQTLSVDGVADTPELVLDSDFVDLNESEFHAILGYALHISAFKEVGERFEATKRFYTEFVVAAANVNDRLKTSALYRRALGIDVTRGQRPMYGSSTRLRTGLSKEIVEDTDG